MRTSPITAREFIEVRRTPGGPAPEETARALDASRELLNRDRAWLQEARKNIENADALRQQRARAI